MTESASASPSGPDAPDLLVIGGGINGAGIARDAAGRGLQVLLVEMGDLCSATSCYSSKLVHGGLRYLEHYEFRLVRESLAEREVLLRLAPHIVRPLLFVLPHDRSMRPVWMIRMGLWLYDHLSRRVSLPGSKAVSFPHLEFSAGLKPEIRSGFVYSDCRVDDARLGILTAVSAREKGATILTRTKFVSAKRAGERWEAVLEDTASGARRTVRPKALANVGGPWAGQVLDHVEGDRITARVRLVKGSHIVVPKVHSQGHAYILQNPDQRVVFVIPYENRFSLIGTTDVPIERVEDGERITPGETAYLLEAANRFLARPLSERDIVSSFAGVRPLYDDGTSDPSSITRDYVLKLDHDQGRAPLVSLFGGKITTYRRLAESTMKELAPFFPGMKGPWTATECLPGGDVAHFNAFRDEMRARYAGLPRDLVEGLVRRHGSRAPRILGKAKALEDLGLNFGAGLTAREVEHFVAEEWARTAEDVLWRRGKFGLHLDAAAQGSLETYLGQRRAG